MVELAGSAYEAAALTAELRRQVIPIKGLRQSRKRSSELTTRVLPAELRRLKHSLWARRSDMNFRMSVLPQQDGCRGVPKVE